jgi:uncharacterized ion transporter superfamily protein YfcC
MAPNPDSLRERLLAQHVPQAKKLEEYRKEVQAMLEHEQKKLRIEKWYVILLFLTVMSWLIPWVIAVGWLGPRTVPWMDEKTATLISMSLMGILMYVWITTEMVKLFINRSRVEILKEVKAIEMQLLELREALGTRSSP